MIVIKLLCKFSYLRISLGHQITDPCRLVLKGCRCMYKYVCTLAAKINDSIAYVSRNICYIAQRVLLVKKSITRFLFPFFSDV